MFLVPGTHEWIIPSRLTSVKIFLVKRRLWFRRLEETVYKDITVGSFSPGSLYGESSESRISENFVWRVPQLVGPPEKDVGAVHVSSVLGLEPLI